MRPSLKFGVYLLPVDVGWHDLRRSCVRAEDLGFDNAWIHDNVVGPVPWLPTTPVFDAWSVLGALGEATSRIRLGPLVTPMGRRHPSLFAKMTASFDQITGGRLDLGMGPGDEAHQFEPWGMEFPEPPERIAILEEEIEILKRLWTEESVTFVGTHYQLDGATMAPKPIQAPHPPIWVGLVFGRKVMPRVAARWADGINFYTKDDDQVVATMEQVSDLCREIGRDPEPIMFSRCLSVWITEDDFDMDVELGRLAERYGTGRDYLDAYAANYERMIVGPPEHVVAELIKQHELGIDQLIINPLMGAGPAYAGLPLVDASLASMERIATDVMPLVREAVEAAGG